MQQLNTLLRSVASLTVASATALVSGCVTDSFDRRALTSTGTIDICHTQATETRCHRERTANFAESIEALQEQEEMAALESLEDW